MPVVAVNGPAIIGSLAMVLLAAYVCYIVHMVVVYSITIKTLGGMSPIAFFKGMVPAMIFAFSSASSVGPLPITLEATEKMGADKDIASFVLPLGATIHMDGTAIYQSVCAIFIAACFGIDLTLGQMATIVVTATLASIGTAGVPGAGAIMLAMVMQGINMPIEPGTVLAGAYAMILGIDAILDMGRTALNVTGDLTCSACIAKKLGYIKEDSVLK